MEAAATKAQKRRETAEAKALAANKPPPKQRPGAWGKKRKEQETGKSETNAGTSEKKMKAERPDPATPKGPGEKCQHEKCKPTTKEEGAAHGDQKHGAKSEGWASTGETGWPEFDHGMNGNQGNEKGTPGMNGNQGNGKGTPRGNEWSGDGPFLIPIT